MLSAPVTPGLVLGECPATGLPARGLRAHKQRQDICSRRGTPLALYFSFHLWSWRQGREGERNHVTRAAQCLSCKGYLLQRGAGAKGSFWEAGGSEPGISPKLPYLLTYQSLSSTVLENLRNSENLQK